uniref:Cytochrome c oxidase subunit 2 n=1 Tax=Ectenagena nautilei TaxID=43211 RepID=A0A3G9DBD3_9BIVA|nr:cytochrome c oxidase subunit II [Ectenagena nautilei]
MGSWHKFWFFDMNTVVGQELILYNDLVMVVAIAVLVVVGWFMLLFLNGRTFFGGKMNKYVYHNELLEIMWTMVPAFMLCFLGYVSLMNLYIMEVGDNVENGLKVTAHQWYWEYSYIVDFSKKDKVMEELWLSNWMESVSSTLLGSVEMDFWFDEEEFDHSEVIIRVCKEGEGSVYLKGDLSAFKKCSNLEHWECKYVFEMDNFESLDINMILSKIESGWEFKFEDVGEELTVTKDFDDGVLMLSAMNSWIPHIFLNGKWNYSYDVYEVFNNTALAEGNFRGYTVSEACYLMSFVNNEMLIATTDVMHSWGVGSLGVKCDAVPGRVNALGIFPLRSGVFYGNCYELCGEGHSMMPISVAVLFRDDVILALQQGVLGTSDCVSLLEEKLS